MCAVSPGRFSATTIADRQSLTRTEGAVHGRPMPLRRSRRPSRAMDAKDRALSSADVLDRSTNAYFLDVAGVEVRRLSRPGAR